jgi:hypothetical protein
VVVPEDRKPGVIKWLSTLRSSTDSVTLSVDRPVELTLTRSGSDGNAATLRVPVEVISPVLGGVERRGLKGRQRGSIPRSLRK